jgi:hypothetical protein
MAEQAAGLLQPGKAGRREDWRSNLHDPMVAWSGE